MSGYYGNSHSSQGGGYAAGNHHSSQGGGYGRSSAGSSGRTGYGGSYAPNYGSSGYTQQSQYQGYGQSGTGQYQGYGGEEEEIEGIKRDIRAITKETLSSSNETPLKLHQFTESSGLREYSRQSGHLYNTGGNPSAASSRAGGRERGISRPALFPGGEGEYTRHLYESDGDLDDELYEDRIKRGNHDKLIALQRETLRKFG